MIWDPVKHFTCVCEKGYEGGLCEIEKGNNVLLLFNRYDCCPINGCMVFCNNKLIKQNYIYMPLKIVATVVLIHNTIQCSDHFQGGHNNKPTILVYDH